MKKKSIEKPKGKIEYELLQKKVDIVNLAADWYLLIRMKNIAEDKEQSGGTFLRSTEKLVKDLVEEHEELTREIEKIFFAYLLVAVASELQNKDEIKASEKKVESVAGELFDKLPENDGEILKYLKTNIPTCDMALAFFNSAKNAFGKLKWEGGYGGKPWAKIADKAVMRLKGEIDSIVFVDVVFDIEHHSGHVFDKHEKIDCDGRKLKVILDTKRDSTLEKMYEKFAIEHKYASAYIKTLFARGVGAKWWGAVGEAK